jgi:hypothetical protein
MAMQKKNLDGIFLVKKSLYFFENFIASGISFINRNLLVMDGHGSHVALTL